MHIKVSRVAVLEARDAEEQGTVDERPLHPPFGDPLPQLLLSSSRPWLLFTYQYRNNDRSVFFSLFVQHTAPAVPVLGYSSCHDRRKLKRCGKWKLG